MTDLYHHVTVPVKTVTVRKTHGSPDCESENCNCSQPVHVDLEVEDSDTYRLALDIMRMCATKFQERAFVAIMQNRYEDAIEHCKEILATGWKAGDGWYKPPVGNLEGAALAEMERAGFEAHRLAAMRLLVGALRAKHPDLFRDVEVHFQPIRPEPLP